MKNEQFEDKIIDNRYAYSRCEPSYIRRFNHHVYYVQKNNAEPIVEYIGNNVARPRWLRIYKYMPTKRVIVKHYASTLP